MNRSLLVFCLIFALAACQKGEPAKDAVPQRQVKSPQAQPRITGDQMITTAGGKTVRLVSLESPTQATGELTGLTRACDSGNFAKCTALGQAQQSAGNSAAAEKAWRKACKADHAQACFELGNILSNPYLKLGREKESVPLLQKACDARIGAACFFLGGFYEKGRCGLAVDAKAAHRYYEKGCEGGHYWACDKALKKQEK